MKKFILAIAILSLALGGCVAYVPGMEPIGIVPVPTVTYGYDYGYHGYGYRGYDRYHGYRGHGGYRR
jgi:hypothetical protein